MTGEWPGRPLVDHYLANSSAPNPRTLAILAEADRGRERRANSDHQKGHTMANDTTTFNKAADKLIAAGADDVTKTVQLGALMDKIGVPMMSFERYEHDPAIRALFNSRGIRRMTPEEVATGKLAPSTPDTAAHTAP